MDRYLCIHAHFYQPPRENPWLETIEQQPSAHPYHDWNERITAECYAANGRSRIRNGRNLIEGIVNNYASISFNFGPTLLSWLEERRPDVYESILEGDRLSQQRFSGHGNAIAQVYNHIILPLANSRDKETQIIWGIRDFERRFGRKPEGMWLAETAVDNETLELLAKHGIKFTILAPRQAAKVRAIKSGARWKDVSEGRIDPTRAYEARLPNGSRIALFFYDGPISQAVAFEKLLNSGERFADRLAAGFSDQRDWPQLMHIATDGETYGHHHQYGDMALAYALKQIEDRGAARLTNYGEFLEKFPPTHEVQVIERTAWSCTHGIERWNSHCGCNSGVSCEQHWRGPLRGALDWLRDATNAITEPVLAKLFRDPWASRNAYIDVILDRNPEAVEVFFAEQSDQELAPEARVRALKLMEIQRHLLLMYTSCGWFFDEISGIETVKVIEYAGRVVQLMSDLFAEHPLEAGFLERLQHAHSNLAEQRSGAEIYRRWVKPAIAGLEQVAAHYAISSLFERGSEVPIYAYAAEREDFRITEAGRARMATGKVRITSTVTGESAPFIYAVVHFGDHNLTAGICHAEEEKHCEDVFSELQNAFSRADLPEALRVLDRGFRGNTYSLKSLFADERHRILDLLLSGTLRETESSYRQVYERHAPLLLFLKDVGAGTPRILKLTAEFVLTANLERELGREELYPERLRSILQLIHDEGLNIDRAGLGFTLERTLNRIMDEFQQHLTPESLHRAMAAVQIARSMELPVNLWRAQNVYYDMADSAVTRFTPDPATLAEFIALGSGLEIDTSRYSIAEPLRLAS